MQGADVELLAKPHKPGRQGRTIVEHTRDVVDAFRALFVAGDGPSELALRWCRFFRVADPAGFIANGLAAAACHDWGKANDGFQEMLVTKKTQLIRHEVVSALIMERPAVRAALARDPALDVPLVLAAVVGHHLKAKRDGYGRPKADPDAILRIYWDELRRQLEPSAKALHLPGRLPDGVPKLWSFAPRAGDEDLNRAIRDLRDRLEDFEDEIDADEPRRRLFWAVRAGLIVADSAGSGLFRTDRSIAGFIDKANDPDGRLDGRAVWAKVIDPRVRQLGERWGSWNPFQEACGDPAQVPARALLMAPCGSGKTLGAWRWIAARAAERPIGRAIFLYPTRGTATEGYRDYAAHAGPEEAALMHGTADLDLEGIHPDVSDEEKIRQARLFALRQWPKRIISATVDQFLGFLQHGYGPTCHLPLLVDSVVVFDEVHSYDRGMFSALTQFLANFDTPALCMTATLLLRRRDQLAEFLTVVDGCSFGDGADDLSLAADHKRYRVAEVADAGAAESRVRSALAEGKRVLWVANTVDRAQAIARRFAADPGAKLLSTPDGVSVYCYHSRYRLGDRRTWHGAVVDAFRSRDHEAHAVLAVTTQVCEMSLDLDADLLVTEFAPATSLVQRLGRCCRDPYAHRTGRVGEVILYQPVGPDGGPSKLPYHDRELDGVDAFVSRMTGAVAVSQADLDDFLEDVPHAADLPKECRFLESGPWAASGEEDLRDIDDRSSQALMPPDREEYLLRAKSRMPWDAQELILPAPKAMTDSASREYLPDWIFLVDVARNRYRPALGLCAERPDCAII